VLAVILVPIPTELGLTEFTGLGALLAYGVPSATPAVVMLSFRILTTGATLLVAGALLVLLRHELESTESELGFAVIPADFIALVHSYAGLLIGGFSLGLAGSSFAVGVAFSTKWFPPDKQGVALGLFGIGNIGQSIAVFLAPRLATVLPWETVFWIFGSASLVWALVFWTFARNARPARPTSLGHIAAIFLRERLSWALSFFYFITFGGFVALGVYLPTLLTSHFGLSLEDAGMRTAGLTGTFHIYPR
jgi:NNP family nitrate/nitrite transporter-like MFS transporter